MEDIKPYSDNLNKKKQIINMFNNIAGTYDLLNSIISLKMDNWWRKNAIEHINNNIILSSIKYEDIRNPF